MNHHLHFACYRLVLIASLAMGRVAESIAADNALAALELVPWVLNHDGVVYHFYCAVGNEGRAIAFATSMELPRQADHK
jgi:hypothetical protein